MLMKKIKYKDFNGNEREDEFYFNMTKVEIIKWMTTNGNYTLDAVLMKLIRTENVKDIIGEIDYLITESYGEKSLDGLRFMKSPEIKARFVESNAYSELFMEIAGDAKKAAEFFNGILPPDLAESIQGAIKENPDGLPDVLKQYINTEAETNNVVPMQQA